MTHSTMPHSTITKGQRKGLIKRAVYPGALAVGQGVVGWDEASDSLFDARGVKRGAAETIP